MNIHGGFYPSGNTLDYKMTHWLFTLFQIISNILTSSLLTFSVTYTFYFYIASEGLKIYQKYLIKKVPDFPFLEKFIRDNLNGSLRNSFLGDFPTSQSISCWKNSLSGFNRFPFSEAKGSMFYFKKTYWVSSLRSKKSWIRARLCLTHHTWKW